MWIDQVWPISYLSYRIVSVLVLIPFNRSDWCIHSFRVRTSPWFHQFWSQTQRAPLCWGRNAAPRRLCKHTQFDVQYKINTKINKWLCSWLCMWGWPEGLGLAGRLAAAGLLAAAEDALQDGQVLLPLLLQSLVFVRHAPLSLWITNGRFTHREEMLTGFTFSAGT